MKRKAQESAETRVIDETPSKKRALLKKDAHADFRKGLFDSSVRSDYTQQYANSKPYASISI
jgi:hypothetical protein